jgi:hypothetical protein
MNLHLREIGREVTPGAPGVLVFDGAGWHTSRLEATGQHHPSLFAILLAGAEPGRKRLGVPAQE